MYKRTCFTIFVTTKSSEETERWH